MPEGVVRRFDSFSRSPTSWSARVHATEARRTASRSPAKTTSSTHRIGGKLARRARSSAMARIASPTHAEGVGPIGTPRTPASRKRASCAINGSGSPPARRAAIRIAAVRIDG
jgi:hypothetical protein